MPYTYEIDAGRSLVITCASGDVTDDDVEGHYERLLTDPLFDPVFQQLIDLRDATDLAITPRFVVQHAARPIFQPGVKRAIVGDQEFQYGSGRMFAALAKTSGQLVWVFRRRDEAERWLDLTRAVRTGARAALASDAEAARVVGVIGGRHVDRR